MSRGPGRPPRDSGEDVRKKILEAATELFSERGYAATPVNAVCELAGVGKPAVYWHFESKRGLLAAVLEGLNARWREQIAARQDSAPPEKRLDLWIEEWRRMVLESRSQLRLPMILQLERGSEGTSDVAAQMWREAEQSVAEGIRDSVGIDLPDLDLLGHTAVTLLQGAVHRFELEHDVELLDRLLAEFRRTLTLMIWDRLPPEIQRASPPEQRPAP